MAISDLECSCKPIVDLDAIESFCQCHEVSTFSFFGSILRSDFNSESNVDILVDLGSRHVKLGEELAIQEELEIMFERPVNMLTSLKYVDKIRRASIESSLMMVYDAGRGILTPWVQASS